MNNLNPFDNPLSYRPPILLACAEFLMSSVGSTHKVHRALWYSDGSRPSFQIIDTTVNTIGSGCSFRVTDYGYYNPVSRKIDWQYLKKPMICISDYAHNRPKIPFAAYQTPADFHALLEKHFNYE